MFILPTDAQVAITLLPWLTSQRWETDRDVIVQCLYNIAHESESGGHSEKTALQAAWRQYAEKHQCSTSAADHYWDLCVPTLVGLATLITMIQVDNRQQYELWLYKILHQRLEPFCKTYELGSDAITISTEFIEELMSLCAWLNRKTFNDYSLICASRNLALWYELIDGRWKLLTASEIEQLAERIFVIMNEGILALSIYYNRLCLQGIHLSQRRTLCDGIADANDESNHVNARDDIYTDDCLLRYIGALGQLHANLKETFKQERARRLFVKAFYDGGFLRKLDRNANLIAFENGVYDLSSQRFQALHSDDYISLSTGYNYPVHLTKEIQNDQSEMLLFLSQLWPNAAVRRTVLFTLAYYLTARNDERYCMAFVGDGINGKNSFLRLYALAMGQYLNRLKNGDLRKVAPAIPIEQLLAISSTSNQGAQPNGLDQGHLTFTEAPSNEPQSKPGDPEWPVLIPGVRAWLYSVDTTANKQREDIFSTAFYRLWTSPRLAIFDCPGSENVGDIIPRFSLETPPKGIPGLEHYQWMVIKFHSIFTDYPDDTKGPDNSNQPFPRVRDFGDKCLRWRGLFMRELFACHQSLQRNPRPRDLYLPPEIVNLNHYWYRCLIGERRKRTIENK